jgi:3-phenylpropionate/trans-cinnamate dioxygenase ferredoxin subunit
MEYSVLTTTGVPDGSMVRVSVAGRQIVIHRNGDKWHAFDDQCTHAECSLSTDGFIDDGTIVCGCHGASFDLTTGAVLSLPGTHDLGTYQLRIDGDDILVTIQE